jgi:WD40 repeat protein
MYNSSLYLPRCALTGLIATASGDDMVRVFREEKTDSDADNPSFSQAVATVAHTQDVNSVAWNPKQPGLLASCSDDGNVKVWQVTLQD